MWREIVGLRKKQAGSRENSARAMRESLASGSLLVVWVWRILVDLACGGKNGAKWEKEKAEQEKIERRRAKKEEGRFCVIFSLSLLLFCPTFLFFLFLLSLPFLPFRFFTPAFCLSYFFIFFTCPRFFLFYCYFERFLSFSKSAMRKASSMDCIALSRGSHWVL